MLKCGSVRSRGCSNFLHFKIVANETDIIAKSLVFSFAVDAPLPTGHVSHPREHDDSVEMCPTTFALLSFSFRDGGR